MEELQIVPAQGADLEAVCRMFTAAIAEMERSGIPQWDEIYPDRAVLREDIEKGQMYLVRQGGALAAAYVLNTEFDEGYAAGRWSYPDASFLVLHRLCVNPAFQHRGIAAQTMCLIEDTLRAQGIEAIRLDAFTQNPYALRLYEKRGFRRAGYVNFRKGRFCLMEKKL